MKYFRIIFIGILCFTSAQCKSQVKLPSLSKSEKDYEELFYRFKNYLIQTINKNEDLNDTAHCKYILLNYILSDNPLDSSETNSFKPEEIPVARMSELMSEVGAIYQFFYEKKNKQVAEHLKAIPIRISNETCISDRLTSFQRENTFVYFDDRTPQKSLGFILFAPTMPNRLSKPRIWSWSLEYKYGLWAFKSPMGIVGVEYLFSNGVEGPPER